MTTTPHQHSIALPTKLSRIAAPQIALPKSGALLLWLALGLLPLIAQGQPLAGLIAAALNDHPATQSARSQQAAAHAGLAGARWQYWPTPSVLVEGAGTSATDSAYQGDQRVATLRLQQPLWTGGRLAAGSSQSSPGYSAL